MTDKKKPMQIYLRDDQLAALKFVSERRGESMAALIREGVDMLLDGLPAEEDPLLDIVGIYDSGMGDLAEKHDEYLANMLGKKAAMSREVFVDTSAWIAVSDLRDKYHGPARNEYNRLIRENHILVTTNLVIAEAYILIRRTGGHDRAMHLLKSLRSSPRLQKVWSDAKLESIAEDILERYTDQDFSFTDAVSFAVMQDRGIMEAFTFDRHFAAMGLGMIPA